MIAVEAGVEYLRVGDFEVRFPRGVEAAPKGASAIVGRADGGIVGKSEVDPNAPRPSNYDLLFPKGKPSLHKRESD